MSWISISPFVVDAKGVPSEVETQSLWVFCAALRLEAPPQAPATVSMVNRTATCRVQMPFEEGKIHLAGQGMLQLTSNFSRCWGRGYILCVILRSSMFMAHPLGFPIPLGHNGSYWQLPVEMQASCFDVASFRGLALLKPTYQLIG